MSREITVFLDNFIKIIIVMCIIFCFSGCELFIQPDKTPVPTDKFDNPTTGPTPEPGETPNARVQYRCPAENTADYTPAVQVNFKIVNNADSFDMDLSLCKVTYCYFYEGLSGEVSSVTYATGGNKHKVIVTLVPGTAEVTFLDGAGIVPPGGEFEVYFKITKLNGENFNQKNDFSWDPSYVNYTNYPRMALYYNNIKLTGAVCLSPTQEPAEPFFTPQPIITAQGIRIEAENYNSASDNSAPNEGLRYRNNYATDFGVDIEDCWLGSFNTGWVSAGEWLEYDVDLQESGNYDVWAAIAHDEEAYLTGRMVINYNIVGEISAGNTDPYNVVHPPGHWQNWVNYKVGSAWLYAGQNKVRIEHLGITGSFNVDFIWLGLKPGEPPSLAEIAPVVPPSGYQRPVDAHGHLQVIGKDLCDSEGKTVQLKGITSHDLRWHWLCKDFSVLRLAYDIGIDIFRVSVKVTASEYGYMAQGHKEVLKERCIAYIDDAIEVGIYGIIDWHVENAIDMEKESIDEAIRFFDETSSRYSDYPNVIYEICSDPPDTISWPEIKDYADKVIPVIRNNAPASIIIVGTPNSSKDIDIAAQDPVTGYANIMHALHFAAGTDKADLRALADTVIANGFPIITSSWLLTNTGKNAYDFAESQAWIDWMADNNVSWINFAFCNKAELTSILREPTGFTGPWNIEEDFTEGGKWITDRF